MVVILVGFAFIFGLTLDIKALANTEVWGASLVHVAASTLAYAAVLSLARRALETMRAADDTPI